MAGVLFGCLLVVFDLFETVFCLMSVCFGAVCSPCMAIELDIQIVVAVVSSMSAGKRTGNGKQS